jgi:hypothetical protein
MMISREDRELEAIDSGLARLFADDQPVPADFTRHVLRRVQDQRWKREVWLGRVFYAGLCASGILVIAGLAFACATLPRLSGDAAMRIAVVALVFTGVASWPRLSRAGLN